MSDKVLWHYVSWQLCTQAKAAEHHVLGLHDYRHARASADGDVVIFDHVFIRNAVVWVYDSV